MSRTYSRISSIFVYWLEIKAQWLSRCLLWHLEARLNIFILTFAIIYEYELFLTWKAWQHTFRPIRHLDAFSVFWHSLWWAHLRMLTYENQLHHLAIICFPISLNVFDGALSCGESFILYCRIISYWQGKQAFHSLNMSMVISPINT